MEKKKALVHGGDWAGYQEEYGTMPLDFSANISPLGMPEGVRGAIIDAISSADRYPDPLCRELTEEIALKEGVPAEYCLCGNGAADLIFRVVLAMKPKKTLLTAPCFAEYEQALRTVGCVVKKYALKEENEFSLDEGFLECMTEDVDMVFLCEPNNPTGIISLREFIKQVLKRCEEIGALLVLDECFNDFLDEPEAHTMKKRVE